MDRADLPRGDRAGGHRLVAQGPGADAAVKKLVRSRRNLARMALILRKKLKSAKAPAVNGKVPAGGNVLNLDGHTEFRKANQLRVRTDGAPTFWW